MTAAVKDFNISNKSLKVRKIENQSSERTSCAKHGRKQQLVWAPGGSSSGFNWSGHVEFLVVSCGARIS